MPLCAVQDRLSSVEVRAQPTQRIVDNGLHSDCRSQVEYGIRVCGELIHQRRIEYRALDGPESVMDPQVRNIAQAPCGQVINREHFMAVVEQVLSEMASNKSSTPCNQRFHRCAPFSQDACT